MNTTLLAMSVTALLGIFIADHFTISDRLLNVIQLLTFYLLVTTAVLYLVWPE